MSAPLTYRGEARLQEDLVAREAAARRVCPRTVVLVEDLSEALDRIDPEGVPGDRSGEGPRELEAWLLAAQSLIRAGHELGEETEARVRERIALYAPAPSPLAPPTAPATGQVLPCMWCEEVLLFVQSAGWTHPGGGTVVARCAAEGCSWKAAPVVPPRFCPACGSRDLADDHVATPRRS